MSTSPTSPQRDAAERFAGSHRWERTLLLLGKPYDLWRRPDGSTYLTQPGELKLDF